MRELRVADVSKRLELGRPFVEESAGGTRWGLYQSVAVGVVCPVSPLVFTLKIARPDAHDLGQDSWVQLMPGKRWKMSQFSEIICWGWSLVLVLMERTTTLAHRDGSSQRGGEGRIGLVGAFSFLPARFVGWEGLKVLGRGNRWCTVGANKIRRLQR